jgi:hypothetical protein
MAGPGRAKAQALKRWGRAGGASSRALLDSSSLKERHAIALSRMQNFRFSSVERLVVRKALLALHADSNLRVLLFRYPKGSLRRAAGLLVPQVTLLPDERVSLPNEQTSSTGN